MSDQPADGMSEEGLDPNTHQEIDAGEPIRQLAGFEHQASPGLLSRIRRTIQRRSTVAQLTSFSASMPLVVLREFWLILIEQLGPKSPRKDVRHGEETS